MSVDIYSTNSIRITDYGQGRNSKSYCSKFSGGIYHDGYVYYVKGTEISTGRMGKRKYDPYIDDATGHLVKVRNNTITDLGALVFRPSSEGIPYIRDAVTGISCNMIYRDSDEALFFISSDGIVGSDPTSGYNFSRYSKTFVPIVKDCDFQGMSVWDVLSELAKLANYELGVSRKGQVFWRRRTSYQSRLVGALDGDANIIVTDGTDIEFFDYYGIVQIDNEIILYTGKVGNNLIECVRGVHGTEATSHNPNSSVWRIDYVICNEDVPYHKTLKSLQKEIGWNEIYNYIIVRYGNYEIVFDYKKAGESWGNCSEGKYGRRMMEINSRFLTDDDRFIAEAIAFRYYTVLHNRRSVLTVETKWLPHIDLGDTFVVFDGESYETCRVRRVEFIFDGAYLRLEGIAKPILYEKFISSSSSSSRSRSCSSSSSSFSSSSLSSSSSSSRSRSCSSSYSSSKSKSSSSSSSLSSFSSSSSKSKSSSSSSSISSSSSSSISSSSSSSISSSSSSSK